MLVEVVMTFWQLYPFNSWVDDRKRIMVGFKGCSVVTSELMLHTVDLSPYRVRLGWRQSKAGMVKTFLGGA